jgi:hypothetical protein
MAITININGLTLCHRGSSGVSHNTLPDVCKTPDKGIPIPYQNEAYSRDLVKGTTTVFADGGNMIANYGSQFCKSVFDEGGSMGGVVSGTNLAETDWISHSFDVFFEKKAACRLTDKLFMNHKNTVNMSGLCQKNLSDEDLEKELCKLACECWNKHKPGGPEPLKQGQQFQHCLNKKIEDQCYDGGYPKPDSPIWREVPYDRGKDWDMIGSKADPKVPTSNPIRPNSRRMDGVRVQNGGATKMYDFKFPDDPSGGGKMDPTRQREYEKIAKKHTGDKENYDEFNVADRCDDCGDPELKKKRAPQATPAPSPVTDEQLFERAPTRMSTKTQQQVAGGATLLLMGIFAAILAF